MKWLQDNPLGMVLASLGAVLIVISLLLVFAWTRPVEVSSGTIASTSPGSGGASINAPQIGLLGEYQIINEKPLFNESRLPEIIEIEESEAVVDVSTEVKDPPDVKLTGVIITPGMRIASLTPVKGDQESVMAHQGEKLTGEYVGWLVSSIRPRSVLLESGKGETLKLKLEVHDSTIKEPPKPAPAVVAAQATPVQTSQDAAEGSQPADRAEQIRQRIAERREELRREQEAKQAESQGQAQANGRSDYQKAIQAMMSNSRKDNSSNDQN